MLTVRIKKAEKLDAHAHAWLVVPHDSDADDVVDDGESKPQHHLCAHGIVAADLDEPTALRPSGYCRA